MNLPRKLLAVLSFILVVMLPAVVFSDVRIMLKNGRSIAADGCQERAGEYVCSKAGGFFTLKKGEVVEIRKISPRDAAPESETATEGPVGSVPGKSQVEKGGKQDLQSSQETLQKRLAEITQRKRELKQERTKLIKDRERLRAELKKAPDWMTTNRYRELSGRITELNKKLNDFNEEVSRLNKEEKNIRDRLQGKAGQPEEQQGRD